MPSSAAILLFTRTAHHEAEKKQFVSKGKKRNERISQKLISETVRKIKQSGFPYFIISSEKQHGSTFGERFVNAVEEVFSAGYTEVIAIGNDSPQLNTHLLIHSIKELSLKDLVLGPDKRGGVYLLGLSKKVFCRKKLLGFHWNTSLLYNDFVAWENECRLATEILPQLKDINDAADLKAVLLQKIISLQFLHSILSIAASSVILTIREVIFLKNCSAQNSIDRRGPPYYSPVF